MIAALIISSLAEAQNVETIDSIANTTTAPQQESAMAKSFNKNSLSLKKGKQEVLVATDNLQNLIAEADSLSRLYYDYNPEKLMYLPIVFFKYQDIDDKSLTIDTLSLKQHTDSARLEIDTRWLDQAIWDNWFENYHINRIIVNQPWLVPYNIADMPEPPKTYVIKPDPKKNKLIIKEFDVKLPKKVKSNDIKTYNWIHQFDASLQFSQAYLSENWYQGGNNNLNMIANAIYNLKLNQAKHPNKLFELTAQYKLGINSAPDDTLRDYSITEDLFQINAKFGLQATKKFYYSMTMQFRTQLRQPREEAFQKTASAVEQAIAVCRRALEGTPHLEFLLQGLCNSAPLSQILLTGDHPQFRQLYQDTCFDEEAAAQALTRQTRRLARQKKKEEIA